MLPGNADEAFLAAQCVATRLYGLDCIRQARGFADTDQIWERKCAAQGASMLRESRHARSLLARPQAAPAGVNRRRQLRAGRRRRGRAARGWCRWR